MTAVFSMTENNLISTMENNLILTNLLEFLEYVCNYINKSLPVDVIYLDFRKAFDKVPHKRLLVKVKAYGIEGKIWSWIGLMAEGSG